MQLTESQFEQLFRQEYRMLYAYSFDILHDDEECRDIVSESFAQLWELSREGLLDNQDTVQGLLIRIVKNRSLNRKKHIQVIHNSIESYKIDTKVLLLPDWVLGSLNGVDAIMNEVSWAIQNLLTKDEAATLSLCYQEGKSYKEAASMQNVSKATINKRLVKALSKIRNYFNKTNSNGN